MKLSPNTKYMTASREAKTGSNTGYKTLNTKSSKHNFIIILVVIKEDPRKDTIMTKKVEGMCQRGSAVHPNYHQIYDG